MLTRREFLKLCANSAAGLGLSRIYVPAIVEALGNAARGNPPVIWLQGAGENGCSVSLLNTTYPKLADVLLKLRYHPTIMAGEGELTQRVVVELKEEYAGKFILVVEGAVQPGEDGFYCIIGEKDTKLFTLPDVLQRLAPAARAIIAVGSCASFGGVVKGKPNPTGAMGVREFLGRTVVNIPGCPAHPDWIIGTLVHMLLYGPLQLDSQGRPILFYSTLVHGENCPNYPYYLRGEYANSFSEGGCLYQLGCKGPIAEADCPITKWNSKTNWCNECRGPCIGCCSPEFPDGRTSPIYTPIHWDAAQFRDIITKEPAREE